MGKITEISESQLETSIIKARKSAFVFVTASWNAGCRVVRPTVEQLSDENQNRISFYELDTDAAPGFASKFAIRSVPAFIVFSNGAVAATAAGVVNKAALENLIRTG